MNIRPYRKAGIVLLLAMASVWSTPGVGLAAPDGELLIIANPEIDSNSIEHRDLQRIYLGKKTQWQDDTTIVPVMLKSGPIHEGFIEDFLDRSVQRFATYWRQMVFTGKGVPPRSFEDESELVDFVARTPGSLGFASTSADVGGVKILTLD